MKVVSPFFMSQFSKVFVAHLAFISHFHETELEFAKCMFLKSHMSRNPIVFSLVFFMLLFCGQVFAQMPNGALSTGGTDGIFFASMSVAQVRNLSSTGLWRWAYGIRYTSVFSWDQDYRGEGDPSMIIKKVQTHSFNFAVHIIYQLSSSWTIGANLDLFGLGTGSGSQFRYLRGVDARPGIGTSPPRYNLFKFSNHNLGNLNSEIFAAFPMNEFWNFRFGISYFMSEMDPNHELANGDNHFWNNRFLGFIGITGR
jgi:hypothetical protein